MNFAIFSKQVGLVQNKQEKPTIYGAKAQDKDVAYWTNFPTGKTKCESTVWMYLSLPCVPHGKKPIRVSKVATTESPPTGDFPIPV